MDHCPTLPAGALSRDRFGDVSRAQRARCAPGRKTLRLKLAGAWRTFTTALDGVGFVSSFLGRFESIIDDDAIFREALGELLLQAVDMETVVDKAFETAPRSNAAASRGWLNSSYCDRWGGTPTPEEYRAWCSRQVGEIAFDDGGTLVT